VESACAEEIFIAEEISSQFVVGCSLFVQEPRTKSQKLYLTRIAQISLIKRFEIRNLRIEKRRIF
jgi:hypothetical protein